MNLLSVGAAYGLMVLVFQKGIGDELFGLRETEVVRPGCRSSCSACSSGSPWTTTSSCSRGSASATCQTGDNEEAVAHAVASTGG